MKPKAHPLHGGQGQRPPEAEAARDAVIKEQTDREAAEAAGRKAKFDAHNGPDWKASKQVETTGFEKCVHPVSRHTRF
jgi:hypothetical protein